MIGIPIGRDDVMHSMVKKLLRPKTSRFRILPSILSYSISADLLCFQRNANMAVPGCSGGLSDVSLSDYCVRISDLNGSPATPAPTLMPVTGPTPNPVPTPNRLGDIPIRYTMDFPLGLCEGTEMIHIQFLLIPRTRLSLFLSQLSFKIFR